MNAKTLHSWDKALKLYSTFQGNGSRLKQRKIYCISQHYTQYSACCDFQSEKPGTDGRMWNENLTVFSKEAVLTEE